MDCSLHPRAGAGRLLQHAGTAIDRAAAMDHGGGAGVTGSAAATAEGSASRLHTIADSLTVPAPTNPTVGNLTHDPSARTTGKFRFPAETRRSYYKLSKLRFVLVQDAMKSGRLCHRARAGWRPKNRSGAFGVRLLRRAGLARR
jgi:hypothetical protein